MPFVPGMWIAWGVLVFLFIAAKMYVARISRNEDDQLVLDDSFAHIQSEQADIAARVHRAQPLVRALMWAAIAMTVAVAGYYIHDMFRQLFQ